LAEVPQRGRDAGHLEPARESLLDQVVEGMSAAAWFSCVDAGITSPANGRPVTSTATTRLAPLVRPNGPPRSWNVAPPFDAPRARCVSMTSIDGAASGLPSASRAAACSTVSARVQVPLPDQRRNCDHTRVQRPNDSGR
jgi:hypothetical protein